MKFPQLVSCNGIFSEFRANSGNRFSIDLQAQYPKARYMNQAFYKMPKILLRLEKALPDSLLEACEMFRET